MAPAATPRYVEDGMDAAYSLMSICPFSAATFPFLTRLHNYPSQSSPFWVLESVCVEGAKHIPRADYEFPISFWAYSLTGEHLTQQNSFVNRYTESKFSISFSANKLTVCGFSRRFFSDTA
jgi:hypothetical protein